MSGALEQASWTIFLFPFSCFHFHFHFPGAVRVSGRVEPMAELLLLGCFLFLSGDDMESW
jgi:hypothetical protein